MVGHSKVQLGNVAPLQPHPLLLERIIFHQHGRVLLILTSLTASIPCTKHFARASSLNAFHVVPIISDHAANLDLSWFFSENIDTDFASRNTLQRLSSRRLNILLYASSFGSLILLQYLV